MGLRLVCISSVLRLERSSLRWGVLSRSDRRLREKVRLLLRCAIRAQLTLLSFLLQLFVSPPQNCPCRLNLSPGNPRHDSARSSKRAYRLTRPLLMVVLVSVNQNKSPPSHRLRPKHPDRVSYAAKQPRFSSHIFCTCSVLY